MERITTAGLLRISTDASWSCDAVVVGGEGLATVEISYTEL